MKLGTRAIATWLVSSATGVLAGALLLHGCSAWKTDPVAAAEGGADLARTDPSSDAGCGSQPPARPTGAGGDGPDLYFAVGYYFFGSKTFDDAGNPISDQIGFDVDDDCHRAQPPCVEPRWASQSHRDGYNGIDNALGHAFAESPWGSSDAKVGPGYAVQVLRIRGYSGLPDDDQVDMAVYMAGDVVPRPDAGPGAIWDGLDVWQVAPNTLLPPTHGGRVSLDQPMFHDPNAYVRQGTIVAHFAEAYVPALLGLAPSAMLRINDVVIAASMTTDDTGRPLLTITSGYKWRYDSFLPGLARIAQGPYGSLSKAPFCQDVGLYTDIKMGICGYVDTAGAGSRPGTQCDSVSAGLAATAFPVLGAVVGASPLPLVGDPRTYGDASVWQCASGIHPDSDKCGTPSP